MIIYGVILAVLAVGFAVALAMRQSIGLDVIRDRNALYRLLEEQVVPTYYQRDQRGVPHAWLKIVKECIRTVTPQFCGARMVKQYVTEMYGPAARATVNSAT